MESLKPRTFQKRREDQWLVRWQGQYMVQGHAALGWFDCRVIDVSRLGAGLELEGPSPASGDRDLIVLLRLSGEARSLQLRGHVRNESACDGGTLRVGIEFFDMTPIKRAILELALERQ
jgi:hypothetical protein